MMKFDVISVGGTHALCLTAENDSDHEMLEDLLHRSKGFVRGFIRRSGDGKITCLEIKLCKECRSIHSNGYIAGRMIGKTLGGTQSFNNQVKK